MSVEVRAQNTISMTSVKAIKDATDEANTLLDSMRQSAEDAGTTLNGIYQDAEDAKANANIAKTSADTATSNLSQIQGVLDVVNWVALHGEYELTSDVAINPNKTYYTVVGTAVATPTDEDISTYYEVSGGVYSKTTDTTVVTGKTYYTVVGTPVANPDVSQIGTYYELSISEAMANYIQAHLALTNDGLYVMADNSRWRVLVASDGVYIIDPNGKKVNQMVNSGNILGREGWIQAYLQSVSFRINEPNAGDMFNIHLDTANTDVVDITKTQYASEAVTATSNANGRVDLIATNTPITEQSGTITLTIPTFEFKITDIVIGGVSKEITSVEALQGGTGCTVSVLDDTVTVTPTTASISADTPIATAVSLNTTGYVRVNYTGGQAMLIVGTYSKLEQKTVGGMSVAVATNHILFAPNSTGVSVDIDCTGRSSVTYPYPINPPSMKFGVNNNINHGAYYGVALGKQLSVNHPNQTVIGKNNDNQNDTAFEIGNGTDDNARSNAFTVDWSGNVEASGDITADDMLIDLPNYQTADTTDKAIYDACVALGWDSDVLVN